MIVDFYNDKIKVFLNKLKNFIVISQTELTDFLYTETQYTPGDALPVVKTNWIIFKKNMLWGGKKRKQYWFYKKFKTKKESVFRLNTGLYGDGWGAGNPQFLVWLNGKMVYGMDYFHQTIQIDPNTEYEMYIYAYTNDAEKMLEFNPYIVEIDNLAQEIYYDLKVPFDICEYLDANQKLYIDTIGKILNAIDIIDLKMPHEKEYTDSLFEAKKYIKKEIYRNISDSNEVSVICIGHSHIDLAWLWTVAQTKEKVLRTFSSVISMMKRYPEYKFMSSQAQLYEFVKDSSPLLYEDIKNLVKEGRWEVEGAMWVEADCNLTGGESIVRQILFGKRFFKKEFNKDCRILWLPDVFGYSAALPQILKKSGVEFFITSKISWNEFNTMPHDTFMWQGIDGTNILTYFMTGQNKVKGRKPERYTNYAGVISPQQLEGTWERYQDKDISNEVLLAYGYGDGGGGPTCEMLEVGKRLRKGFIGCPELKFDTAGTFFEHLKEHTGNISEMPKWVGELYLEFHRGTYTSMAKNKRNNRKSEILYHNVELISCMGSTLISSDYPQKIINDAWKTILVNQFHDIIPGTSIKEVYDQSDIDYEHVLKCGKNILEEECRNISDNVACGGDVIVFNNTSFAGKGTVYIDNKAYYTENIPPDGYRAVDLRTSERNIKISKNILENKFFTVKFKGGDIVSIFDKDNNREVIERNKYANELIAFEDFPKDWDAWEITNYYERKCYKVNNVISVNTVDYGEKFGIKVIRKFLNSTIEQEICLYVNTSRIDFDTHIDWKESHILLKTAFPIDIHTEKATYDIQFGNVERPTHRNTSWDQAKFEVCAHKFADVSEDDWGVSLINDCKYGYDIHGSTMRLTLLKCATYPNPEADKCEHRFTYSIYTHRGNFKEGGTVKMAYEFNNPLIAVKRTRKSGNLPVDYSFVSTDCDNIVIETIKKAEDSDRIIIRLYDCFNRRSKPCIKFGFNTKSAYLTDMMENEIKKVDLKNNTVCIDVNPYEIVTLAVEKMV